MRSAPVSGPPIRIFKNPRASARAPTSAGAQQLSEGGVAQALQFLELCPKYVPTPTVRLRGLAGTLGLDEVWYKDESARLGLGSFKALGGVYAVAEIIRRRASVVLRRPIGPEELLSPQVRSVAEDFTFICASDGNHGLAVAAGARLFGANCQVFVHDHVAEARRRRILACGAEVSVVGSTYDDCVELAERGATHRGWVLLADTSDDEYAEAPELVMRGYSVLAKEAFDQIGKPPPSHIFVQAGVGGLAAAVASYAEARFRHQGPKLVVVEPRSANGLVESNRAGELVEASQSPETVYAMLECRRPSRIAWNILRTRAHYFVDIDDDIAGPTVLALARGAFGDAPIECSESGVAGVVALCAATGNLQWRRKLGLSASSSVLLIGTEGQST